MRSFGPKCFIFRMKELPHEFSSNFVPLWCRFEARLGSSYPPFLVYYTHAHSEINFVNALSFNLYIWGSWFLVQTQTLGIETAPAVLNRKSQFLKTEYFSRKADTSHISATVHRDNCVCESLHSRVWPHCPGSRHKSCGPESRMCPPTGEGT